MPKGPTNHPTRSDIDVLDLQPGVTSELAVSVAGKLDAAAAKVSRFSTRWAKSAPSAAGKSAPPDVGKSKTAAEVSRFSPRWPESALSDSGKSEAAAEVSGFLD